MQIHVGRRVPDGFLPVYSCVTKREAMELVVLTCQSDGRGGYWNRDLAIARQKPATSMVEIDKQLASLDVFSDKLAAAEAMVRRAASKKLPAHRKTPKRPRSRTP